MKLKNNWLIFIKSSFPFNEILYIYNCKTLFFLFPIENSSLHSSTFSLYSLPFLFYSRNLLNARLHFLMKTQNKRANNKNKTMKR